jgi:predicted aldo/keto reductase-like oxidoreductase
MSNDIKMRYCSFGKDGFQASILGFGAMRLPLKSADPADIDFQQATEMIHLAVDGGVNYIDTAYVYHNGKSESAVGQALKNGYLEKVRVATKLPQWAVNGREDMDRIFDEQLSRLETDRIDNYLLHALNKSAWEKLLGVKVLDWAQRRMQAGQIGHLGFSFHDGPDIFRQIIDEYDWDFCQIQYNYMDTENQAGTAGLQYAAAKNIPVIVMEPLRGGSLANPPENIKAIFNGSGITRSPAEWGLFWAWSQPGVSLVLSGMSSLEQVRQNLSSVARFTGQSFSEKEQQVIAEVKKTYLNSKAIACTQCSYCMPCPYGINIPGNFAIYNEAERYQSYNGPKWQYANRLKEQERAGACTGCQRCLTKCPQKLEIPDLLEKVHQALKSQ